MNEELKDALKEVDDNYLIYEDITNSILTTYVGDLDELMQDFNADAIQGDADDRLLEKYLFELGNQLYFLSSKIEQLGIKEDISKLLFKEAYNLQYLSSREKDAEKKNKLTVAELTAIAENNSREQQIVNILYSRIYSQIKLKMNAAYDLVNSIRKIITRRMQEQNLSFSIPQNQNLNVSVE